MTEPVKNQPPDICPCCKQELARWCGVKYHIADGELSNLCPKFGAMHEAHLDGRAGT